MTLPDALNTVKNRHYSATMTGLGIVHYQEQIPPFQGEGEKQRQRETGFKERPE